MVSDREWVEFATRADLRNWLEQNHGHTVGIWAVYPRGRAEESDLSWESLVEECLCFGWIDSLPGKVDEHRTRTYISPRKKGSGWSRRNQVLIEKLTKEGRMHSSGSAVVSAAQADGSWSLFDLAEDLVIPADLAVDFDANPMARVGFDAYPERLRKSLLQWYYSAKSEETRKKRRGAIVDSALRGERPKGF